MNATDVVASMRLSMQERNRPVRNFLAKKTAVPQSQDATPASIVPATVAVAHDEPAAAKPAKLKKIKSVGNAVGKPGFYALATALFIMAGVAGVWKANVAFAPEMYDERGLAPAVNAFKSAKNYAVFDLNLNIRRMRELQVASFAATPDVVLIGASHWQEAHAGLVKSGKMYNGHVHRDYWEDLLGVVEVYVRNQRLPKKMIIAIRDKQFTPVEMRSDYLWEPGIGNYRAMAKRLGLASHITWRNEPRQRIKERLSLSMLFSNVTRWYNAKERPHATAEKHFKSLDTLLPDGSILWSSEHMRIFSHERARREALAFAENSRKSPPVIDPEGVAAFDKLLDFLKQNGTEVTLVNPPFNPVFYDHVKDTAYMKGLDKVREVTARLASAHGLKVIGEFDPAKVGCTADMYIDAEHSNPDCLVKIFRQFDALYAPPQHDSTGGQS